MDEEIEKIQERLSKALRNTRTVFWEDGSSEYAETIRNLSVDGAEVLVLDGHELAVKRAVLREYPDKKFVLYRSGGAPNPSSDLVLDLKLASVPFVCSMEGVWAEECGIDPTLSGILSDHAVFFRNKERRAALKDSSLPKGTPDELRIAMCAATMHANDATRRDVARSMAKRSIVEWASGNEQSLRILSEAGLAPTFWNILKSEIGYEVPVGETPSVGDLSFRLLEGKCGSIVKDEFAANPAEASRILDGLARDRRTSDVFDMVIREYAEDVAQLIPKENRTPSILEDVDAIPQIDEWILLQFLAAQKTGGMDVSLLKGIWAKRRYMLFGERYLHHYEALISLGRFFEGVNAYQEERGSAQSLEALFGCYTGRWNSIDRCYREFFFSFDKLSGKFKQALDTQVGKVVDTYDAFLADLTDRWQLHLMDEGKWPPPKLRPQSDFFHDNVELAFPKDERGRRVGVIISDALRYEAGADLAERLSKSSVDRMRNRMSVSLSASVSMIPSYTQLGMAALLPDGDMTIDPKTMLVTKAGSSTQGLDNRSKVIARRVEGGTAFQASDILTEATLDLSGISLAVVYHNVIDKIGDSRDTEGKVFEAAETAFDEIERLVRILVQAGCGKVVITADHGFLYQREDPESYSYADVSGLSELKSADTVVCDHTRRFVVGDVIPTSDMLIEYSAADLSLEGDYKVAFPKGTTRLRLSGSGTRFVHGGASLQENVVPVITVAAANREGTQAQHPTPVAGYPIGRTMITGPTVSIIVYQGEPCGDAVSPATVKVGVYSTDGALLSAGERKLDLASDSLDVEARKTRVTLRLTDDADDNASAIVRISALIGGTNKYKTVWEQEYSVNRAFGMDF